jgi:hypothetical protein
MPSLIEATDVPLAGIRLITGTSVLLWPNVYDLRDYFVHSSVSGTSGDGGAPTDAEYVVMSLDGTLTDERVLTAGADIDIADGGAGGNATVSVETGTFSRAGHAHLYPYSVPVYEDEVFQVTGSILDFTTNMNVVVTGSVAYISSVAGGGGGANVLPIFDDGSFEVTGSAISFDEDLDVVTTGTVAFVYVSTGTFARVPHTHPASQISDVYAHDVAVYEDHVFQVTGTILDFTGNMNVAVTGSVAYISSVGGAGGGDTLLIYDDGAFQVTGTALSFDDELDVSVTGSVAYVNVATGTFSQPGHTHYSAEVTDLQHAIPVSEDSVFEVTGTHIDFGENMNVVVTGSVVFVSSIDTQGGGGGDLLIYDDSAFRVTGTALDFGDNISVVVTGSVAYIGSALTEAALDIGARVYNSGNITCTTGAETKLTFDSERYDTDSIHSTVSNTDRLTCKTAGKYLISGMAAFASGSGDRTILVYLNNTTIIGFVKFGGTSASTDGIHVSCIYDLNVSDYVDLRVVQGSGGDLDVLAGGNYSPEFMMHKIDGISANRIPIYDDSAFRVTGTALDFGDNISVVVTGSTAYISSALTEAALDIGAKVYNSTGIAIPNNAWTELTFDSEKYDTDNIHSITTNTSRLTCQTSGKYLIVGNAQFDNDATGIRGYRILLNGTTILAEIQEDGMGFNVATISIIHDLNVNDYVELEVYHQVGSLDIIAFDDYSPYFMMQKIDGISANRIPIYDDSVIQTTGTSISFDENLDVDVTGSTAYVNLADTVVINDDIYTDVWQSFTGTYNAVGWSSFTSEIAEYKRVGNLVFVNFDIRGTSNSTGTQFTVPYTNEMGANATIVLLVQDNGSILHGQSEIAPGGDLIRFWKDLAFGQWTASGAKRVSGQIFYETT